MQRLLIKPTKSTPEIIFDPDRGTFSIYGASYPENAYAFYTPIIDWLDNFIKDEVNNEVDLTVKLQYYDTSSSKCLLVIFEKLEAFHLNGNRVNVKWLYDKDDYDSFESAEELFLGLSLPRKFIEE